VRVHLLQATAHIAQEHLRDFVFQPIRNKGLFGLPSVLPSDLVLPVPIPATTGSNNRNMCTTMSLMKSNFPTCHRTFRHAASVLRHSRRAVCFSRRRVNGTAVASGAEKGPRACDRLNCSRCGSDGCGNDGSGGSGSSGCHDSSSGFSGASGKGRRQVPHMLGSCQQRCCAWALSPCVWSCVHQRPHRRTGDGCRVPNMQDSRLSRSCDPCCSGALATAQTCRRRLEVARRVRVFEREFTDYSE
jgi:hypothetical protein